MKTGAETYSSALPGARNYMRWLIGKFDPYLHGRILETGIGHGSYYPMLRERGAYIGIDIDPTSIARARSIFPDAAFAQCDILNLSDLARIVPDGADAVLSMNVLEHVVDDEKALENLVHITRPGGHLLLIVPALMILYNELDRLAGHHRRYTAAGVAQLLRRRPVEIVSLGYMNALGALGWWLNSFTRPTSLDAASVNGQIRLFDRYVLPLAKAVDPLFSRFMGQSVICVARRR